MVAGEPAMILVLVRAAAVLAVVPVELRREQRAVAPNGAVLRAPEAAASPDAAPQEKVTMVVQGYSAPVAAAPGPVATRPASPASSLLQAEAVVGAGRMQRLAASWLGLANL